MKDSGEDDDRHQDSPYDVGTGSLRTRRIKTETFRAEVCKKTGIHCNTEADLRLSYRQT